jgi:redox-sensitive bicupin YhaK (pirin superfamily)
VDRVPAKIELIHELYASERPPSWKNRNAPRSPGFPQGMTLEHGHRQGVRLPMGKVRQLSAIVYIEGFSHHAAVLQRGDTSKLQEATMTPRTISQLIRATAVTEGAGVTVHRTIGTAARRHLDPFLMLDHFGSDNPNEYIAGFPDHPHRGFVTLTYMLDGHMLHQDSMGNRGDLRAGGAQWMKAASGVIHSEMPQQTKGLMRGFQLWINLPAAEKMSDPGYQEFSPAAIPEVHGDGSRVKILCGEYGGSKGPIQDPSTQVQYLDVTLDPNRTFLHPVAEQLSAFVYVFEGDAVLTGSTLLRHSLAILGSGTEVEITAGPNGARFILVAGRPLGEPIVQYGPFVMNTREEIEQALEDYRDNKLVRKKAALVGE